MMKKHTFFLLIGISFFCAFSSYAQKTKINLNVKMGTIKEVTAEIEKKSDFIFVFADDTETLLNRKVNIVSEGQSVESILNNVFANTELRYRMLDKQIVIYRGKKIEIKNKNTQEKTGQSKIRITGKVSDINREPLIGVSIIEEGTANGTTTDINGSFSIEASKVNSKLKFTYTGYGEKLVEVKADGLINVILEEQVAQINEIVVVGYGTQKRQSVTGAVSQIAGTELLKGPVGNINNLLAGRITGVVSLQNSGQPGSDAASILVRGGAAKYIVDGFERGFSEIDPNEIETVSVLKDASSASVYGLDAGAVIIVTTKRGRKAPSIINFTGGYGISQNALMLEMLDGPGYAYWYNKATEMDGNTPIFTSGHVQKMKDGVDGWGNTNWYNETFGIGNTTNLNLNASGGTEKLKYFVSLGTYTQEGNVRNFNYSRYNLRSNVDAVIAENLDLSFDIAARIQGKKAPLFGAGKDDYNNIPQQAIRAHPYVPKEINGIPVSTRAASVFVSPLAASSLTGYNNANTNVLQTNISLNFRVPFIKGLSLKAVGSYDVSYHTTKRYSTPYQTYVANTPTATSNDISYNYSLDSRGDEVSLVEGLSRSTTIRTNLSARYENKFGLHSISSILLAETSATDNNSFGAYGYGFDIYELDELDFNSDPTKTRVIGGSSKARTAGFLGRATYDYAGKYLGEVSLRYDGSYVFGGMVPGKRWSPFPAGSLGWRISEEDWFKQSVEFVDNLKLRGAVGLTGRTGISPYYYLSTLTYLNSPAVVLNGVPLEGLQTSKPGNVNLSWEKTLQYNVGVDAMLWNGLLGVEIDIFYKFLYDILVASSQVPDSWGGFQPGYENVGKQDHKGFEFNVTHRNKVGNLTYNIGLNATYAKRRWLSYPDAPNTPDWLKLTGKDVGAQIGFIANGLFQSQEEIDESAVIEAARPSIGDIRYVDRNGDGVISYNQDRGYVGESSYPKFIGGLNIGAEWRGLDFALLFQSGLGRDIALTGVYSTGVMSHTSMTKPFYGNGNSPRYLVENSWTENNRNAEFPRLSVIPKSGNNAYSSTFWYRNGNYLRLKNIQLGYTLPSRLIKPIGFEALRLYVEGQNLFTLSELSKYGIDPEQPTVSNGYYPQQRIYNVGMKLTF